MPDRTSVIIASDRPLLATGLRVTLDTADGIAVVDAVSSGLDLLTLITSCPDCVAVADARLFHGTDGATALRLISERQLARMVVGVAPHRPAVWLAALLRNGVQNCVLDTDPVEELVRVVQATAAGERYMNHQIQQLHESLLCQADASDAAVRLTDRELEVLALVASGMSDAVIGRQMGLATATVVYHVREARQKLGAATRAQAVMLAIRFGWLPLD